MTKRENRIGDPKAAILRLDLNRKHTEAEVELVRTCFDCSEQEARGILGVHLTKERLAEVRGMLDAMCVEREEQGRSVRRSCASISPLSARVSTTVECGIASLMP